MAQVDPKYIAITFDGYSIAPSEFGDADIEINHGGETSEVMKGIAGGSITQIKYDKIDTLTFTLLPDAENSYRLEEYHSIAKQVEWIIKDTNPAKQRSWTSSAGQVKSFDAVQLTKGAGYAFTVEFEDDLQLS